MEAIRHAAMGLATRSERAGDSRGPGRVVAGFTRTTSSPGESRLARRPSFLQWCRAGEVPRSPGVRR
jgi:hypothetical protein